MALQLVQTARNEYTVRVNGDYAGTIDFHFGWWSTLTDDGFKHSDTCNGIVCFVIEAAGYDPEDQQFASELEEIYDQFDADDDDYDAGPFTRSELEREY